MMKWETTGKSTVDDVQYSGQRNASLAGLGGLAADIIDQSSLVRASQ